MLIRKETSTVKADTDTCEFFLLTKKTYSSCPLFAFLTDKCYASFFPFVPACFHGFLFVKWHNVKHKLHCVMMCVQDDSWHVSKTGAFQFLIWEETMLSVFLFMDLTVYLYRKYWLVLQSCMIMFGVYNDQYSISNSISSQMCYSVNVSSSSTVCQSISNEMY